uniref:Uncharacterized protein n=1 Tax=Quercus lobata TaxID=97700 RepID=A0A7N2L2U4_QUELO
MSLLLMHWFVLYLLADVLNSSFSDCDKNNPEMDKELKKDLVDLLSEELNLQKDVANESIAHTKVLILDATKTLSHYQKEAEKCNVGMETCEEGREKAERELIEERKLSALWEKRARKQFSDKGFVLWILVFRASRIYLMLPKSLVWVEVEELVWEAFNGHLESSSVMPDVNIVERMKYLHF